MTQTRNASPQEGVQFAARDGRRSSQAAGKAILAAAVRSVDESLASRIENMKDWRKGYIAPFRDSVIAGAASPKAALMIATDGLDAVQNNLTFARSGEEISRADAIASPTERFETATVPGKGERVRELAIPYRGRVLSGDSLSTQLEVWETAGVIEASAAGALTALMANPEWLDLSDLKFAVLGAASEMGPFGSLCSWGATVMALDLPRPDLWTHILETARAGSGTVLVPVSGENSGDIATRAGIDLLTHAPEARAWLTQTEDPFTLGNYVYADGATFVRLAAAVDSLVAAVVAERPDVSLAYLATPTDVYAVPEELAAAARATGRRSLASRPLRALSGARLYSPNYQQLVDGEDGRRWGISDSLVPIQGPNYALAKSLQRWRAVVAREDGVVTSANVAPASSTTSVTKNRMLAAAYRGAPAFGVEIFEPGTTRVLTAALLVHDLRNQSSAAHPAAPLRHPYDLFVEGAAHGGIWRLPHQPRSILPLGLIRGLVMRGKAGR